MLFAIEAHLEGDFVKRLVQSPFHLGHEFCAAGVIFVQMCIRDSIYTEALICLRSILQADHPEFKNWIDWLERDIQDWNQRQMCIRDSNYHKPDMVFPYASTPVTEAARHNDFSMVRWLVEQGRCV